jgi:hypothetical protein
MPKQKREMARESREIARIRNLRISRQLEKQFASIRVIRGRGQKIPSKNIEIVSWHDPTKPQ